MIINYKGNKWMNKALADDLFLSPAELSNSLNRSMIAGLIDEDKKKVRKLALFEFLVYGLPYVFPQQPGGMSRGMPTAHSHPFFKKILLSDQVYVWPDAESDEKGSSVQPLYPGAVKAAKKNKDLYLLLALADVLRTGKTREKKIAAAELKRLINEPSH
jgi:hypothetical protein